MNKRLSFFIFIILFFVACKNPVKKEKNIDLADIKKRGYLVAYTQNNSSGYFIYKGETMGFQYELLEKFVKHIGVKLRIVSGPNDRSIYDSLNLQVCDIVAMPIPKSAAVDTTVAYTVKYSESRLVLVQRKADKIKVKKKRRRKFPQLQQPLIRNINELGGKVIHIASNPEHQVLIYKIADSIRQYINVIEVDQYEPDHLIYMVSKGSINYVICPEDIALLNQQFYDNIDIKTIVSPTYRLAWAVRKNSPSLLDTLNKWLKKYRKTSEYKCIYNKYYTFTSPQKPEKKSIKVPKYNRDKQISPYDESIIKYSAELGWDWRIVAALICIESKFNPNAYNSGNIGLMQLAPMTAHKFGIHQGSSADSQIRAGVKYLKLLDKQYASKITDINTRIKFVIAAYNIGDGHVWDAIRLAEKHGRDPTLWEDNVAYFLMQKTNKQYYRDPVVKYGYCNGEHACNVVERILGLYGHYRNVVK